MQSIVHLVDTVLLPEISNVDDTSKLLAFSDGSSASLVSAPLALLVSCMMAVLVIGMGI